MVPAGLGQDRGHNARGAHAWVSGNWCPVSPQGKMVLAEAHLELEGCSVGVLPYSCTACSCFPALGWRLPQHPGQSWCCCWQERGVQHAQRSPALWGQLLEITKHWKYLKMNLQHTGFLWRSWFFLMTLTQSIYVEKDGGRQFGIGGSQAGGMPWQSIL